MDLLPVNLEKQRLVVCPNLSAQQGWREGQHASKPQAHDWRGRGQATLCCSKSMASQHAPRRDASETITISCTPCQGWRTRLLAATRVWDWLRQICASCDVRKKKSFVSSSEDRSKYPLRLPGCRFLCSAVFRKRPNGEVGQNPRFGSIEKFTN